MLTRFALLAIFVVAALPAVKAADDPFIGRWKLDLARSKITGQTMDIQETESSSYVFKEDEHSDEVMADGLDHLTHFATMAITRQSADTLVVTYKRDDAVTLNTTWKIAADNQSLIYTAAGTRPNGQKFNNQIRLKRKSGESGFSGGWESTDVQLSSPLEIYIDPWQDSVEITEQVRGKTIETAEAIVSDAGQTQTIVITEPGDPTPEVLVYAPEAR